MGQKVNPTGFRLGCVAPDQKLDSYWSSYWFSDKCDYKKKLKDDIEIRKYVSQKIKRGTLSGLFISRKGDNVITISMSVVRSRSVLAKIEEIESDISKLCSNASVSIKITEEKRPDISPRIVAQSVAMQLEKRISYKKAMKKAIASTMAAGAKGIKISCAGRLGGAEIARSEWYREGQVPLHTIRANIGYTTASAKTTYGVIGVKVWINV